MLDSEALDDLSRHIAVRDDVARRQIDGLAGRSERQFADHIVFWNEPARTSRLAQ